MPDLSKNNTKNMNSYISKTFNKAIICANIVK